VLAVLKMAEQARAEIQHFGQRLHCPRKHLLWRHTDGEIACRCGGDKDNNAPGLADYYRGCLQ